MENGPHFVKEMNYDRTVRHPVEEVTLLVTQVEGLAYLAGHLITTTTFLHTFCVFCQSVCSLCLCQCLSPLQTPAKVLFHLSHWNWSPSLVSFLCSCLCFSIRVCLIKTGDEWSLVLTQKKRNMVEMGWKNFKTIIKKKHN